MDRVRLSLAQVSYGMRIVSQKCKNFLSVPLHFASRISKIGKVKLRLGHGTGCSCEHVDGKSPLHYAVCCKAETRHDVCKLLLEKGADCNDSGGYRTTPFIMALEYADLKMVKLLLDHGGDISGEAHLYAVHNPNMDVFEFILDQGADVEGSTNNVCFVLHYAIVFGNSEKCELLLRSGAMVNTRCRLTSETPLSLAVTYCDNCSDGCVKWEVVNILLEYGANASDEIQGKTIFEIAEDNHTCRSSMELLISHMVKMNLNINEADRRIIGSKECYRRFYDRCVQEVDDMKNTNFYNEVSVFRILTESLTKSENAMSAYPRNDELVQALEDKHDYEKKYLIYFSSLNKRLDALEMQKSRYIASKILSNILQFNDRYHPVNQKILSFLRNQDLKYLEV